MQNGLVFLRISFGRLLQFARPVAPRLAPGTADRRKLGLLPALVKNACVGQLPEHNPWNGVRVPKRGTLPREVTRQCPPAEPLRFGRVPGGPGAADLRQRPVQEFREHRPQGRGS